MHTKASAAANNYFHYDSYSFSEAIAHLVCEIYMKKNESGKQFSMKYDLRKAENSHI